MYKIYLSPSTKDKSFGVNNFGTEEFRMNQIADAVETYLLQTGNFAIYRNVNGMTTSEIIKDSNEVKPDAHIIIHTSNDSNHGLNCYVKVGDNMSNGIGKEVYKQVHLIYHNKNIDNGLIYDESIIEIHEVKASAIKIVVGSRENIEDATWIIENIDNIGKAIALGIEKGFALKVC